MCVLIFCLNGSKNVRFFPRFFWLIVVMLGFFMGCAPSLTDLPVKKPAQLGYITSVHRDLVSLPVPKEKIVAAVYKFRDQTGQYKTSATGVSWSTAVTQGATSMLLKALEDSKWFTVLEREGLSDLLNERKIIRSSRENFTTQEGETLPPLPPMLYAGVILEGGIVSYETNTVTGGIGAKYFGIGGSTQYRKDEVSIYLRAVSTQNGRVLKTVYTTKSILSMAVDINVYRYVRFKRLLEVETGYSVNEPPQMCVLEAIEKAVISLVVEGIVENLWSLNQPQDIRSPVIISYLQEKRGHEGSFDFDLTPINVPRIVGIGFSGGFQKYMGDYSNAQYQTTSDLFMRLNFTPRFGLSISGNYGKLSNEENFSTTIKQLELKTIWTVLPSKRLTPYVVLGGGLFDYSPEDRSGVALLVDRTKDEPSDNLVGSLVYGGGLEFLLTKKLALFSEFDFHYMFSDQLDGVINGRRNDSFAAAKLGLTLYFAD
jgi:curli production assembly/transport component CsgG